MPKHARKRQKTSKDVYDPKAEARKANLNVLLDDSAKDDEERRLESALFGTKFTGKGKEKEVVDDDELLGLNEAVAESRGLAHLGDEDVRTSWNLARGFAQAAFLAVLC